MFRLFNEFGMRFTLYAVARRCVEMGHDVASQ
jgi:hypothetical protein